MTLEDGSAKQLKKSGQEHWIYIGDTPIAREYDGMIVYHIPETSKVEISQQNTLSVPRGGEFRLTLSLSLIHISEPTRLGMISYAVFCLKKKNSRHYGIFTKIKDAVGFLFQPTVVA